MFIKRFRAGFSVLSFPCLLLLSCSTSQKTTSDASANDCDYAQAGDVRMRLQKGRPVQISGNNLPGNYTVFTAENQKAFFRAAQKQEGIAAIRLPSGCRQFKLSLSETMSPEMRERYPDLVSLKGRSTNGADLRLDWDGTSMNGQIIENGKSFVLQPYAAAGSDVYLFFSKDDVTTPARPFEKGVAPGFQKHHSPAADR